MALRHGYPRTRPCMVVFSSMNEYERYLLHKWTDALELALKGAGIEVNDDHE